MFTLVRSLPFRTLLQEQFPVLIISLTVAELFYKFHSFTLETGAFLLTWLVLDASVQLVKRLVRQGTELGLSQSDIRR
jgi:hypothetical protein